MRLRLSKLAIVQSIVFCAVIVAGGSVASADPLVSGDASNAFVIEQSQELELIFKIIDEFTNERAANRELDEPLVEYLSSLKASFYVANPLKSIQERIDRITNYGRSRKLNYRKVTQRPNPVYDECIDNAVHEFLRCVTNHNNLLGILDCSLDAVMEMALCELRH